MKPPRSPRSLVDELAPFSPVDLLTKCAAAQMCPDNAQRLFRLEHLAINAASLPPGPDRPSMSMPRYRRLLESGMGVDFLEDPFSAPLVVPVAFTGGSYLTLPGLTEHLRPGVDLLLSVSMLAVDFAGTRFRESIAHPCQALLRLSDAMCSLAGLRRGQAPATEPRLVLPTGDRLAELTRAVSWTDDQLRELFSETNVSPTALHHFELPLGVSLLDNTAPGFGPLLERPLIRDGRGVVIALPHSLLTALSRYVLGTAHEHGLLKPLAEAFHSAAVARASHCLKSMGLHELAGDHTTEPPAPGLTEQMRWLDTDKLVHLIIVSDDLETYRRDDPFGSARFPSGEELDRRFRVGVARAKASKTPPREVLGLVVVCGVARFASFGVNGGSDEQQVLLMHLEELDALSVLEPGRPLYLWHFARARERFRQSSAMIAWSLADELFFFRQYDSSFYMGDDQVPTLAAFQANAGDALSQEAYARLDPHVIAAIDGRYRECVRVFPDSSIPVYAPKIPSATEAAHCVEVEGGAIWVYSRLPLPPRASLANTMACRLVESLAFWLGRMVNEPFVRACGEIHARIEICVISPDRWGYPSAAPSGEIVDPGIAVSVLSESSLRVEFPPEAMSLICSARGHEERVLLLPACRALATLAGCSESDADTALATAMPTAKHRSLVFVSGEDAFSVRPRCLPPLHLVDPAAEQEVLDEVRSHLVTIGIPKGPLPAKHRTRVLNQIVALLFEELVKELSYLNAEGLLQWLVAQNEAIVDALTMSRHLEPYNLACFAEHAAPARKFADRLIQHYKADQASRFLIEYVSACPPSGATQLSFATFDRLMALSSKIIFYGTVSDDVQYGTDDPTLTHLQSGRLGIGDWRRESARDRYLDAYGAGQRARLLRESRATEPKWISERHERAMLAITQAAQAEFGYTLEQHATIMRIAVEQSLADASAETSIELETLVLAIADALAVEPARAMEWIEGLSIRARPDFFAPPKPAERSDVYPWRFNRRWSYVRRPFLIAENRVVYGSSHVDRAGSNLQSLCSSGRLKATSPAMQKAMGKATEANGARFNHTVAELFRAHPRWLVRERVKKFGGLSLTTHGGDLGDIDVLVVDSRARCVRAYECKDLSVARTPSEIHNELSDFTGNDKSIVAKHSRRVHWLRANLRPVLHSLGVASNGKWDVGGVIVIDEELMSPFLVKLPMPVISIADVEAIVRDGGMLK